MNVPSSSERAHCAPARPSRRAVLGLALGATLASIGGPACLAVAKPKRQPKAAGTPDAEARRKPGRNARRRPNRRPQAKPRFKILTRTFSSNAPITIPDTGAATPYPAIVNVGGLRAGIIQDVNVTLSGFSHTFPTDLEIILVAPNGRTAVVLMSDTRGSAEITKVTLVFDDQAASFLPYAAQIVSGTFKPTLPGVAPRPETASLRAFNRLNPNGAWRLYVADGSDGDEGSIGNWALTIQARVRV